MHRLVLLLQILLFSLVLSGRSLAAESETVTLAYVASGGNNHVRIVNLENGQTLNKLYTGAGPWRLLKSPDGKRLLVQHWYAETTAVVNLASNRIEQSLPVRGPAVFNPEGDRLWSYSWPASLLHAYDAKTFKPLKSRLTEDKVVYDMVFWGKDLLAQGQYDPISLVGREVYESVLVANLASAKSLSSLARAGISPARLVLDPSGELLLTANVDDRDITILNKNGDGRRITLAAGPRDIVISPDGKRIAVVCWARNAQHSDIFTLDSDFSVKPWPVFKAHKTRRVQGGLTAMALGNDGLLYVLDRRGGQLIAYHAETLEEVKSIPVGDDPMHFVLHEVAADRIPALTEKTEARRQLETIIERIKLQSAPFTDVTFTEKTTLTDPDTAKAQDKTLPANKGQADKTSPTNKANEDKASAAQSNTVRVKSLLRVPDAVRQKLPAGQVRLAQGGQVMTLSPDGRYNLTPRQELLHVLYALGGLSTDEAIRQLAGDVPGSPFLRNGIAVDIVQRVEEEGKHYFAIGATKKGQPVSQLWVSADSGLPVDLVEQFPVIRSQNPHQPAEEFQGLAETKLEYAKVGERAFPARLLRYIDGTPVGEVTLDEVAFNQNPAPDLFQLAQLGGVLKPVNKQPKSAKGIVSGPGLAVVGQGNEHIPTPFAAHVPYNTNPPTSGPHTPYIANWGVHKLPISPEVQAHNLEDGGVLVQYACADPCDALVKQLEGLADSYDRIIVAPYPLMTTRIALTAWQRIETLDDFDEQRIRAFIEAYIGKDHHAPGGELPMGPSLPPHAPPPAGAGAGNKTP